MTLLGELLPELLQESGLLQLPLCLRSPAVESHSSDLDVEVNIIPYDLGWVVSLMIGKTVGRGRVLGESFYMAMAIALELVID